MSKDALGNASHDSGPDRMRRTWDRDTGAIRVRKSATTLIVEAETPGKELKRARIARTQKGIWTLDTQGKGGRWRRRDDFSMLERALEGLFSELGWQLVDAGRFGAPGHEHAHTNPVGPGGTGFGGGPQDDPGPGGDDFPGPWRHKGKCDDLEKELEDLCRILAEKESMQEAAIAAYNLAQPHTLEQAEAYVVAMVSIQEASEARDAVLAQQQKIWDICRELPGC